MNPIHPKFTQRLCLPLIMLGAFLCLALSARAFEHPCIPATIEDLDTIKASLNQEPWKSGYAILAADSHSSLNYTMQGPFGTVTRNPNLNLGQWENDMEAVWDLSRMWYFTGNTNYAQKAHDILIAWSNTQTNFGGQESGLDLGDYAYRYGGGADVLRSTWPGWTAADTAAVSNLFMNVYWPACSAGGNVPGEFNKGLLNMEAGIALALFCDNTNDFNHIVDTYRTYPGAGLSNLLPTGETGETGRDNGHVQGGLLGAAFISECAWKQGIDLYSDLDNRLLACEEYYARNTLLLDNPFVPYGTVDYTYYTDNAYYYVATRSTLYLVQNAYKNRFHLPTPWIDFKLQQQNVDNENWMYAKTADFTTATPLAAIVRPAVSLASGGLTLTTLGAQTSGSSSFYTNGVWTMSGLGNGVWVGTGGADDCQFVYQAMTGDCALVAQVTSFTSSGSQNGKVGLMLRDNLSPTVSERGWIGVTWQNSSTTNLMECRQDGWTENWGGSGWASRSQVLPPGLPYWLKIERRGNLVTTYSSQDGTSWAPIVSSYYGNLPSTVYIGMFLCSGNTTTNTATFANVAFTGGSGGLVTTPAAPAALFTSGSGKAITVRWLPSFGATAYDLLRSTTSGSGYAVIASNLTASKTSYVDANVSAGTTYYYVVQAKNSAGTSGNSPEFYAALLPAPMVNLAFSGTSTASFNGNSTTEGSAKAFDRDPGSKWFGYNAPTGWLQYDFGVNDAQVVKRYTISSADVAARDPGAWNFLASQDGTNWTTLDSQTNQSFANRMQQNTYNIGNTTAYRYYRLDITTNNGDPGVAVAELGLWGESGRTIPDGRYRLVSRNSNKVMDGGAITNGAPVLQQAYNGGNSQQWEIAWQGNGRYRATAVGSTNAIDNSGTSSTGANLVVQPWSGGTSQLWNIIPDSDNFYRLTSANSGLVADVSSGSTADGANIIQWTSNGGDNQEWMPSLGRGTQPPPIPPAPTDLSASAVSSSQINLTWTASPGATSYNVKRATISGGPYTTIGTASDTSFTDVAVVTNQTYYYVVTALNSGGESGNSQEASAVPQEALHAYLKFDEFSGTNAADSTGNGWNGTLVNGPTWVAGYSNNAANLSGSSQYVTLPAGVLTNLNDFTISAWVKQTTISTWSRIFDFGTGQSVYMFLTPRNGANNVVRFAITTGGGNGEQRIDGAAALPTNVWTHVAVTLSGSTGVLYVNGVPVGTNSAMTLKPGDLGATTQNYIGKSQFNDPYFNGQVDEFRIYRTALSPADVATLVTPLAAPTGLSATAGNGQVALSWNSVAKAVYYHVFRSLTSGGPYTTIASLTATSYTDTTAVNGTTYYYVVTAVNGAGESANSSEVSVTPSDLQDWWTFDTSSGTVAADSGIGGNNGTLQSGASWVSGIINNAVHLDGTSSAYVSYPIGMVSNLNNFSIATWVRVDSTSRWARIFDFGSGTGTYMFMTANSGSGTLRYAITTSSSGGEQQLNSAALSTGVWHHVAVTLSGSTGVLYVDGAAVNTNSNMTLNPASLGVTTQNYLGKSQWNDPYLTGSVDDFRIYSRALSASEVAAFVAGIIPAPPTGLAATAGNAQVSLTWNASANASSYNVKRATVNGGPYTTVANAATTGYTDTSVANGTTYYYVVSALNAGTESADSTPASAMPQVPPPATPTGLAATAGNAQVALSWNASSGAASYNLKRATVNGGPYTTLANLTATGYTDTNVINGLTYYYVVSAVNAGGESANSTQVNATPQVPAPATPTGLAAAPDYLQITLSWNSSSGATSYDVKRATVNGGPYTTITNVATTSFTDDAITMGTTYYYVVSAVNAGGESANSSQVDATSLTLPSPWSTADIGAVGLAGSAMYSNSIYTVTGSGADTWGASDQFRYVYQTGGTNCSITVQVLTMTTNSSAAAKGGVMVRESLATNSVMCEMQMTALNGAENLWRASTGGNVTGVSTAGLHAPYWVRITRAGSKFTSYRSSDGITWTPVSTNTITMASSVNVGLFVCSHNNSALCTATFTNVVASP